MATPLSDAILADSPVGYWRLDETSGTTATDSSGNGNHGTYTNGPTLGQPGFTQGGDLAASFDGTNDHVLLPSNVALDLTATDWTMEAWIKRTALKANNQAIFGGDYFGYGCYIAGSSSDLAVDITGRSENKIAGMTNPLNGWQQVVFTFVAATKTLTGFTNGAQIASRTLSFSPDAGKLTKYIARNATGAYFTGLIQHAAIYHTALSAGRVAAHYAAGLLNIRGPASTSFAHGHGTTTADHLHGSSRADHLHGASYSERNT